MARFTDAIAGFVDKPMRRASVALMVLALSQATSQPMKRSIVAVVCGVAFIVVASTLVDILLHAVHVYRPWGEPLSQSDAVIATSYRIVISILGAALTAWLAPRAPMRHALYLGVVGTVLGLAALAATWGNGLAPLWYPIALVLLAVPQCWAGGRLFLSASAAVSVR